MSDTAAETTVSICDAQQDEDAGRRLSFSSSATQDSGISTSSGNAVHEAKTIKQYRTNCDYLFAMVEDLAEWFNDLYSRCFTAESFLDEMSDGILLCMHAAEVHRAGEVYFGTRSGTTLPKVGSTTIRLPNCAPGYNVKARLGSFISRDNIANFIAWAKALGIADCLLFETEDLVGRKNDKSVVLCLLEIARIGAKFGVDVPDLIQLEQDIDAEIYADSLMIDGQLDQSKTVCTPCSRNRDEHCKDTDTVTRSGDSRKLQIADIKPKKEILKCDLKSLDEMVREILSACTCQLTFPMKRLAEGKYLFGDNSQPIFVRVLRNHVMVRVGGGWDTLEHMLYKHDPCRYENKDLEVKSGVPVNSATRLKKTQPVSTEQESASDLRHDIDGGATPTGLVGIDGGATPTGSNENDCRSTHLFQSSQQDGFVLPDLPPNKTISIAKPKLNNVSSVSKPKTELPRVSPTQKTGVTPTNALNRRSSFSNTSLPPTSRMIQPRAHRVARLKTEARTPPNSPQREKGRRGSATTTTLRPFERERLARTATPDLLLRQCHVTSARRANVTSNLPRLRQPVQTLQREFDQMVSHIDNNSATTTAIDADDTAVAATNKPTAAVLSVEGLDAKQMYATMTSQLETELSRCGIRGDGGGNSVDETDDSVSESGCSDVSAPGAFCYGAVATMRSNSIATPYAGYNIPKDSRLSSTQIAQRYRSNTEARRGSKIPQRTLR